MNEPDKLATKTEDFDDTWGVVCDENFDEIVDENLDEPIDENLPSSSDDPGDMAGSNIGQVEPFVVGKHDWTLYVERVKEYLVANGISTDVKKRAVLVTLMGSEAYELLASLVAPDKPSTKTSLLLWRSTWNPNL